MLRKFTLLLTFFPFIGFAQLNAEWHSEDIQYGFLGDDIGFDYTLTNDTNVTLDITWRFEHELANSTGTWEDYMCEGIFVCWPSFVRRNTFQLEAGQEVDMYHHIQTFSGGDTGTFVSTAHIWVGNDSLNAMEFTVTVVVGLKTEIDGTTAYIIHGDTFEMWDGELVPLSVNSVEAESITHLTQNSPNPFSFSSVVNYNLESGEAGKLVIYDLVGKEVQTMPLNSRSGIVTLSGLEAGVYFYSLWADDRLIDSKRMQVVK